MLQMSQSSSAAPNAENNSVSVLFTQTWRDPRFDDLSGEYKPEIFEKTYKFINDIRHREKEVRTVHPACQLTFTRRPSLLLLESD